MNNTSDTQKLDFYSFFSKYSLMEEYGFTAGVVKRLLRKLLPLVKEEHTIEYVLTNDQGVQTILSYLSLDDGIDNSIIDQLDLSIKALSTKLVAFGLDSNIMEKFVFLDLDPKPFLSLLDQVSPKAGTNEKHSEDIIASVIDIQRLITDLRKNKNIIGTNFHLTLVTRRILEYSDRLLELLDLKSNIHSQSHWKKLLSSFDKQSKHDNSITRYFKRHTDLVALEIVEHTAQKGGMYIAENKKEYASFFFKSLLGGGIIAFFALGKILLDALQFSQLINALAFSMNYAACFIIVKQFGGIIATKQPAMTASTIAKKIDKQDDLILDSVQSVIDLFKKVFSSQFISILGNFMMALILSTLLTVVFQYLDTGFIDQSIKPDYLLKSVQPSASLIFYAAIAGVFLATAGVISGHVDNKMVASKIGYRLRKSKRFFESPRLANYIEKKGGALMGNISLGFFLGSSFLLSHIVPFNIDIRHIAFSSANVGYAIITQDVETQTIMMAVAGVLLIGFVNFIVSFVITLYLALRSRGADKSLLRSILFKLLRNIARHPLSFIYPYTSK